MIAIIDCGMGNLGNIKKALDFLGAEAKLTHNLSQIKKAEKIILPGVGNFGKAVEELKKRKIFSLLKQRIEEGVKFLGICLGMQLLLKESEEARNRPGLGIIKGVVRKFPKGNLAVPHMGWNEVTFKKLYQKNMFRGIRNKSFFYFAHSYFCDIEEKQFIAAETFYSKSFASALCRGNVWATQFHPEKSQAMGLRLIKNFISQ